jgi:hypothetical protein
MRRLPRRIPKFIALHANQVEAVSRHLAKISSAVRSLTLIGEPPSISAVNGHAGDEYLSLLITAGPTYPDPPMTRIRFTCTFADDPTHWPHSNNKTPPLCLCWVPSYRRDIALRSVTGDAAAKF